MKTIYIHIGLGKTGTTTIQKHMGQCYKEYLRQGLRYIQSSGGIEGSGHQNFAKSFITELPYYMQAPNKAKNFRNDVAEEIKNSDERIFLLSSENFPIADPKQVKIFFDEIAKDFQYKILLFVRSQDELAESEYNQIIKVRNEHRSFYSYVKSNFDGDFMNLAMKWESEFGRDNLICHVYNAKSRTAISNFIRCLPIDLNKLNNKIKTSEESNNKSSGFIEVVIKRMLNILHPNEAQNKHIELSENITNVLKKIDIPSVFMNSKEATKFRKSYKKSNKKFNKRYLKINSSVLNGRKYTDQERDRYFNINIKLTDIYK